LIFCPPSKAYFLPFLTPGWSLIGLALSSANAHGSLGLVPAFSTIFPFETSASLFACVSHHSFSPVRVFFRFPHLFFFRVEQYFGLLSIFFFPCECVFFLRSSSVPLFPTLCTYLYFHSPFCGPSINSCFLSQPSPFFSPRSLPRTPGLVLLFNTLLEEPCLLSQLLREDAFRPINLPFLFPTPPPPPTKGHPHLVI